MATINKNKANLKESSGDMISTQCCITQFDITVLYINNIFTKTKTM